jgi:hypothetical protein
LYEIETDTIWSSFATIRRSDPKIGFDNVCYLELPGFRGHYKSLVPGKGGDRCPGKAKIEAFAESTST